MIKDVYRTILFCMLFIFFSCAFAQDEETETGQAPASLAYLPYLQRIDTNLLDFLEGFKTLNVLKKDEEGHYVAPKLSDIKIGDNEEDELKLIKEPAQSMIRSLQYPPDTKPPTYNTIMQEGLDFSSDALLDIFTILDLADCPNESNCVKRNDVIAEYAGLAISSPYNAAGYVDAKSYATARDKKQNPRNKSLDINSLLGPLIYAPTQASQEGGPPSPRQDVVALDFIKFITAQSIPVQIKNPISSGDKEKQNLYIARLRNYASHQSIDLSNYYQMLARRIKQQATGKSQLQMEQEMTSRRLNSDWHDKMEEASPVVIQREILYLLAEINYQLYLTRVDQERLLATVTAQHALQLQSTIKPNLLPEGETEAAPWTPGEIIKTNQTP